MSVTFQTPYQRQFLPDEPGGGRRLVETAGYIPAQRQITDMIQAGARLDMYRKGQYDYEHPDHDDGFTIDPTRSPNFDLADAYRLGKEASQRLAESKAKADQDAKQKSEAEARAKADAEKQKIISEYLASQTPKTD